MGCDIHIYPEARRNGVWQPAEPFVPASWWYERFLEDGYQDFAGLKYKEARKLVDSMSQKEIVEKYGHHLDFCWHHTFDDRFGRRNYNFFGILAGVRSDFYPTIVDPRGLPEDVSPEVKRHSDYYDGDGHTHSWITLRELMDYDWDQGRSMSGDFSPRMFENYLLYDMRWAHEQTQPSVTISNNQMAMVLLGMYGVLDEKDHKRFNTIVDWTESPRRTIELDLFEDFFATLHSYGSPEDVRIVFWFDC